jgi:hypothetical protein
MGDALDVLLRGEDVRADEAETPPLGKLAQILDQRFDQRHLDHAGDIGAG